jgi:ABC-type anion transport system duplicated permease subunit
VEHIGHIGRVFICLWLAHSVRVRHVFSFCLRVFEVFLGDTSIPLQNRLLTAKSKEGDMNAVLQHSVFAFALLLLTVMVKRGRVFAPPTEMETPASRKLTCWSVTWRTYVAMAAVHALSTGVALGWTRLFADLAFSVWRDLDVPAVFIVSLGCFPCLVRFVLLKRPVERRSSLLLLCLAALPLTLLLPLVGVGTGILLQSYRFLDDSQALGLFEAFFDRYFAVFFAPFAHSNVSALDLLLSDPFVE